MKIISIGEVLWDVIGRQEHLGGAPFNFAAHAKRLGHEVFLVSAVGNDPRGRRILRRMAEMDLSSRYVHRVGERATGIVTVTLDAAGQPRFVIHRPAAYDFPQLSNSDFHELVAQRPDWICFGTLFQMSPQARELTRNLTAGADRTKRFYDVNLRAGCYEPALVRELMSSATVVKLNAGEASEIAPMLGLSNQALPDFCRSAAERFGLEGVCVTRGSDGCALRLRDEYVESGGYNVQVVDTIGAGDAFAAAFLHGLASGWPPAEIADFANRVGALTASRPGAIPPWTLEEARALTRR